MNFIHVHVAACTNYLAELLINNKPDEAIV